MTNRGFSLVETMVALGVGAIVMLLIGQMLTSNLIGRDRALGVTGAAGIASSVQSYLAPATCFQIFRNTNFTGLPTAGWPVNLTTPPVPLALTDMADLRLNFAPPNFLRIIARNERVDGFTVTRIGFTRAIQRFTSINDNNIDLLQLTIRGNINGLPAAASLREINIQLMIESNPAGALIKCAAPTEWGEQKSCENPNAFVGSWSSAVINGVCIPNIRYEP